MSTVNKILIEILLELIGPIAEVIAAIITAIIEFLSGGGDGGMNVFQSLCP